MLWGHLAAVSFSWGELIVSSQNHRRTLQVCKMLQYNATTLVKCCNWPLCPNVCKQSLKLAGVWCLADSISSSLRRSDTPDHRPLKIEEVLGFVSAWWHHTFVCNKTEQFPIHGIVARPFPDVTWLAKSGMPALRRLSVSLSVSLSGKADLRCLTNIRYGLAWQISCLGRQIWGVCPPRPQAFHLSPPSSQLLLILSQTLPARVTAYCTTLYHPLSLHLPLSHSLCPSLSSLPDILPNPQLKHCLLQDITTSIFSAWSTFSGSQSLSLPESPFGCHLKHHLLAVQSRMCLRISLSLFLNISLSLSHLPSDASLILSQTPPAILRAYTLDLSQLPYPPNHSNPTHPLSYSKL